MLKTCRRCGTETSIENFYAHRGMKDGHLNFCIECTTKRVRKHRALNDSTREYDSLRASLPHRKELCDKITKRNKELHPEKYKAQCAVNNAVRDGRLFKPITCSLCNQEKRLIGHHEDYTKPLDVEWLCYRCHAIHHHAKEF